MAGTMTNEAQRRYWEKRIDRFDAIYDDNHGLREWTLLSRWVEPLRRSSLQKRFDLTVGFLRATGIEGKSFIDAGCGTGRLTEFLLQEKACFVMANDITRRALILARKRIEDHDRNSLERVAFWQGDVTELHFPRVDYFIGLGLVEYLADMDKFLANIQGKCKYLVVNYPSRFHWKRPIRKIVAEVMAGKKEK